LNPFRISTAFGSATASAGTFFAISRCAFDCFAMILNYPATACLICLLRSLSGSPWRIANHQLEPVELSPLSPPIWKPIFPAIPAQPTPSA
jgi:hypothetical protein